MPLDDGRSGNLLLVLSSTVAVASSIIFIASSSRLVTPAPISLATVDDEMA